MRGPAIVSRARGPERLAANEPGALERIVQRGGKPEVERWGAMFLGPLGRAWGGPQACSRGRWEIGPDSGSRRSEFDEGWCAEVGSGGLEAYWDGPGPA